MATIAVTQEEILGPSSKKTENNETKGSNSNSNTIEPGMLQPDVQQMHTYSTSGIMQFIRTFLLNNIEFFQRGSNNSAETFYYLFCLLLDHLDSLDSLIKALLPVVKQFDFSADVPGNGYRSLITITNSAVLYTFRVVKQITNNRGSFMFRTNYFIKELQACCSVLGTLKSGLKYVHKLYAWSKNNTLFIDIEKFPTELLVELESINQECFYGRALGFQYCECMQKPLQVVSIAMASYSEGFTRHQQQLSSAPQQENKSSPSGSSAARIATSIIHSGKYMVNPELKARQIVHMTQNASIQFCKAFWALTESDALTQLPGLVCPSVQVNRVLVLPPGSPLYMSKDSSSPVEDPGERTVVVMPPDGSEDRGYSVKLRLLSYLYRDGQDFIDVDHDGVETVSILGHGEPAPLSPYLIFHCHGGGFVAQSSKAHEVYLRYWARNVNVPILSVDYSLAPENSYPVALDECLYAYVWARNNPHKLGWLGERVIVCGDSAGANLMVALCLKLIALKLPLPDGVLSIYGAMLIQYTPSPSRILSLMDPLLPIGILGRCLTAYAGIGDPSQDLVNDANLNKKVTKPAAVSGVPTSTSTGSSMYQAVLDSGQKLVANSKSLFKSHSISQTLRKFKLVDEPVSEAAGEEMQEQQPKVEVRKIPSPTPVKFSISGEADEDYVLYESTQSVAGSLPTSQSWSSLQQQQTGQQQDNSGLNSVGELDEMVNGNAQRVKKLGYHHRTMSADHTPVLAMNPVADQLSASTSRQESIRGDKCIRCSSGQSMECMRCFWEMFHGVKVAPDPLISPLLASDDTLAKLPPLQLIACHLDPLLDDSVEFARRVRKASSAPDAVRLHILPDLPHGFLNFTIASQQAKRGSDECERHIRELLHMDD